MSRELALELACCHLIAMTDMKASAFKKYGSTDHFGDLATKDDERRSIDANHISMMSKAIKILQEEGSDPQFYRDAITEARALPDEERTAIAMNSPFLTKIVPEDALMSIMDCVMGA
jgi:hypothetical protein